MPTDDTIRVKIVAEGIGSFDNSMAGAANAIRQRLVSALADAKLRAQELRDQMKRLQVEASTRPELASVYKEQFGQVRQELVDTEVRVDSLKQQVSALGRTSEQSGKTFATAIRSNLSSIRALRMAMYSTVGLLAVSIYIEEWSRLAQSIRDGALALGGFDANLRQVQADAVAASMEALKTPFDEEKRILNAIHAAKNYKEMQKSISDIRLKDSRQAVTNEQKVIDDINNEFALRNRISDLRAQAAAYGGGSEATGYAINPQEQIKAIQAQKELVQLQLQQSQGALAQKSADELTKERTQAIKDQAAAQKQVWNIQIETAESQVRENEKVKKSDNSLAREKERIEKLIFRQRLATAAALRRMLQKEHDDYIHSLHTKLNANVAVSEAEVRATVNGLRRKMKANDDYFRSVQRLTDAQSRQADQKLHLQEVQIKGCGGIFNERNTTDQIKQMRSALDDWYKTQVALLNHEMSVAESIYGKDVQHYQAALEKKKALDNQYQIRKAQIDLEAEQRSQQMVKRITDYFNQGLMTWISGQQQLKFAWQDMWNGMVTSASSNLLKMTESWALNLAKQKIFALMSIKIDAGKSAADTMAHVPFPENIPAALMTFAKTMAFGSFDQGGIVPKTGMHMLHKEEMVLPKHLSQFVQNAASGGSGGSRSSAFHLHYSPTVRAFDTRGAKETLWDHANVIGDIVLDQKRKGRF